MAIFGHRKWHYFTLFFKAPKSAETVRISVRYETDRMGQNRIGDIRAGEGLSPDSELVGIIRHGRMTELQWKREI